MPRGIQRTRQLLNRGAGSIHPQGVFPGAASVHARLPPQTRLREMISQIREMLVNRLIALPLDGGGDGAVERRTLADERSL